MEYNNNQNQVDLKEKKLKKKIDTAGAVQLASGIMAGIFGGVSLFSLVAGMSTGVASQSKFNEEVQAVYESDDYQEWIRNTSYALLDECVNGKITFEEYKECIEILGSSEGAVSYMQAMNDERILKMIEDNKKEIELATKYLSNGFAGMGALATVAGGVCAVAGESKKKRNEELKKYYFQTDVNQIEKQ